VELNKKRVLVTGADGFIGSHLVEQLVTECAGVKAFVYYNSFNSWGWLDTLPRQVLEKMEVCAGDVRDANGLEQAIKGCDVVFHLAALIGIPFSYNCPDSYLETNVKGTLNVLQAARKLAVERVLVTSTSEVYGSARYVPIDENHPFQAQSPYSATKIAGDRLAESFYRSFQLPVVVVRPFNTYGPRQSARAVIPTIIVQLLSGASEIKLGSLAPIRDFTYVKDTVSGFIELAKSDKSIGEEVNIATGQEVSIGQLAHELIARLSPATTITCDEIRIRPSESEVERLLGCNDKIKSLTNWKPQYDLATGLSETVAWFKDPINRRQYKSDIYNV
jgi:NAD dependent epimerase/dehydratase